MPAQSYDPTLKALVEIEPESWPTLFGRPVGPTAVIDADIATVSGAADKVLRVSADPAYLLHIGVCKRPRRGGPAPQVAHT